MAITRYVPPIKKIIDNRKPEGGYYEADCEVCGTKFYPERSNAKYCTPNCGLIAHRMAVANGTAEKRPVSKSKAKESASGEVVTGRQEVVSYMKKQGVKHHGLLKKLMELEIGEQLAWEGIFVTRVTSIKYRLG